MQRRCRTIGGGQIFRFLAKKNNSTRGTIKNEKGNGRRRSVGGGGGLGGTEPQPPLPFSRDVPIEKVDVAIVDEKTPGPFKKLVTGKARTNDPNYNTCSMAPPGTPSSIGDSG